VSGTEPKGIVRGYSSEAFVGNFDPTMHVSAAQYHAEWNCFDQLMTFDPKTMDYKPGLAVSWERTAPSVWRFKLRENVKFHDGSPFTAEAVKTTMEYATRKDGLKIGVIWPVAPLVEVVDDYTIDVKLEKPAGWLFDRLASEMILAVDDVKNPERMQSKLNGTGPFKMVSFEEEEFTFEANEDYWAGPPKLATFKYKYVPDPYTRLAGLQTGEVDFLERMEPEHATIVKQDANLVLVEKPCIELKYLYFHCSQPPVDDKLVRQAIGYAVDSATIIKDVLEGAASEAKCFVSQVSWGREVVPQAIEFNLDKAKELLEKAGYPGGKGLPEIKYVSSTGFYPKAKEISEFITQTLSKIGINCSLQVMETGAWYKALSEETGMHVIDGGWLEVGIDPDLFLMPIHRDGLWNFYNNEESKAIISKQSEEADPDKRLQILKDEVYPRMWDDLQVHPYLNTNLQAAYRKSVKGLEIMPSYYYYLKDVTVEEG
jgi:peptide/nickel transport system substrate-binding protein